VQILLQRKIGKMGDAGAVRKLILTDWVRVLTMAGHFVSVAFTVTL
jgi:hypothetical protein